MFEISWSELLILGLVTLIFVGPKELPRFFGTLGRYAGVVRRHANEFRAVFEQAMREAELDELQKEVRGVGDSVKASLDEATRSVDSATGAAQAELDAKAATAAVTAEAVPPSILPPAASATSSDVAPPDESGEPAKAEAEEAKSSAGPA
ncbi:MAG: twin-arginine translocase TatA/TatE family subunit [Hyphomicrobium sp.]|uniref:Sec-independent protein translocase subunit TatA/TatB n=1 Tax=Hyphomicrobium sp. TaxID=82 RepID=UPI003D0EE388